MSFLGFNIVWGLGWAFYFVIGLITDTDEE